MRINLLERLEARNGIWTDQNSPRARRVNAGEQEHVGNNHGHNKTDEVKIAVSSSTPATQLLSHNASTP